MFISFLAQAMIISMSGVMAPGPLTAAVMAKGAQSPRAGAWIAVGHGLVEFPLMAAMFFGLGGLFQITAVKSATGFIGGVFLAYMGIGLMRALKNTETAAGPAGHSPVLAGVVLSAGNPYFLLWWATIGSTLVFKSAAFGLAGFIVFAVLHWSGDFAWSWFLSAVSFKGGKFFGQKFQKVVFTVCGVFLLFFSVLFIVDAIKSLSIAGMF